MMDFEESYEKYENLIRYIVGKYKIIGLDYEDLMNIGRYVMWVCCKTFDTSKGIQFSTYFGKALHNECYKMYKYTRREKRSKDSEIKYMDDYCKGDLTYSQVIESPDFGNIEEVKLNLYQLTDRLPLADKKIILEFLSHKLNVNQDYTIKEYCQEHKISYIKMRRILDDFRYVISVDWGY